MKTRTLAVLLCCAAVGVSRIGQAGDLGPRLPVLGALAGCSAYGEGFLGVPGSQTCLRLSGRVRAEYFYASRFTRDSDVSGYNALGLFGIESRTATSFGDLRTVVRLQLANVTGSGFAAQPAPYALLGSGTVATGADFANRAYTSLSLDAAFVQFAGFTAGRTQSFFEFYANDIDWYGVSGSDHGPTNLIAYTAAFGDVSTTLSIEDPVLRRQFVLGTPDLPPQPPKPFTAEYSYYGGSRLPDIVGNLRIEQGWGAAQLSGALHQIVYGEIVGAARPFHAADYGFAANAGVRVNLNALGDGDTLALQATYGLGATNYAVGGYCGQGSVNSCTTNVTFIPTTDAVVDGTGAAYRTEALGLVAAGLHYWRPTLRQGLFISYSEIDEDRRAGLYRSQILTVGSNLVWSPVKDLDIGAELQWNGFRTGANILTIPGAKRTEDQYVSRIRVQRDF